MNPDPPTFPDFAAWKSYWWPVLVDENGVYIRPLPTMTYTPAMILMHIRHAGSFGKLFFLANLIRRDLTPATTQVVGGVTLTYDDVIAAAKDKANELTRKGWTN